MEVFPISRYGFDLISERGEATYLANDVDFSMSYFITTEGRWVFSLRSADDKADVSAIAKKYGGGGHQHASGFTLGLREGAEFLEKLIQSSSKD